MERAEIAAGRLAAGHGEERAAAVEAAGGRGGGSTSSAELRAAIDAAVFDGHQVIEAGGRVVGGGHPIRGSSNIGTGRGSFGTGDVAGKFDGAAFCVDAAGPGDLLGE